jgi:hypothetical protein
LTTSAGWNNAVPGGQRRAGQRSEPAGPEDVRTVTQRRHDALEEACRRLIAAHMVPGRAGQPTQAQVHMTLAQLRNRCALSTI